MVEHDTEDGNTGWVRLAPEADGTATMRIATSLISVEQAKRNLEQEIGGGHPRHRADRQRPGTRSWIVEVEGASPNELTTLSRTCIA